MNKNKTIAVAGIGSCLSFILGQVNILGLPQGGNVSLFAVPVIFIAATFGIECTLYTITAAIFFSLIKNSFVVHPAQIILDYVFPNLCFCLVCFFNRNSRIFLFGIFLAYTLNFFFHFTSGILFYQEFAPPGQPVWLYSLTYNATLAVPEMILVSLVSLVLYNKISRKYKDGSRKY